MITLLDAAQKQSTVAEDLDDIAICNLTIKTFKQIFSSHIARAHGLHILRYGKTGKQYKEETASSF